MTGSATGTSIRVNATNFGATSEQQRPNSRVTGHHQGPEDEARHFDSRPSTVCKTSTPVSNPGGTSNIPSDIRAFGSLQRRRAILVAPNCPRIAPHFRRSDLSKSRHCDELSACDLHLGISHSRTAAVDSKSARFGCFASMARSIRRSKRFSLR